VDSLITSPSGEARSRGRGRRGDGQLSGAALVIVLSFLVIITGLVVAFLSSVTNEATSTAVSAVAVTTRTLADAAIQLDIAQIRDATAGFSHNSDGSLNTASPVCWASQPGAIRTYDTNASGGNPSGVGMSLGGGGAIYKLYSSTNMVDTNGGNPTNDLPATGWTTNSAQWTDLNSPVISRGNTNYPIMDPYMTNLVTGSGSGGGGASVGSGSPMIDGFSINTNAPAMSGVSNQAAMPVQWIYVLKNGTLTVPSSVSSNVASFSSNSPTSNNPIVGRIAFWTDDETCKLNINTASEGSFWGTPSFTTLMDVNMGLTQPAANEFNRLSGHPASTSLSPVLWSYMGLTNPSLFMTALPGNPGNAYAMGTNVTGNSLVAGVQNYYTNLFGNITPRYLWGGSASGVSNTLYGSNAITSGMLPSSRLYASVDEFFFAATNPAGQTLGQTNLMTNFAPQDVSRLRFFLTTESRAPEVNPLNLPKISLWPEPDTNNKMTANPSAAAASTNRTLLDQTIAFCSTLGTNAYYFARYDATSPTNDMAANKGRNQKLYNYLRNQLNQPQPGFLNSGTGGFTAANKWAALQADQITTLLFDYIRGGINLIDSTSVNLTNISTSTTFPYSYTVPSLVVVGTSGGNPVTNVNLMAGSGQVVPISITNPDRNVTQGFGRFPTIRAGTLWMIARGANQPPLMVHPDGRPIVYLSNGVQISTNPGSATSMSSYIMTNYWTNMFAGKVYARINPLHPWTCPQTNVIGSLTNVVPQLTNVTTAVLSDTNLSTTHTTLCLTNLTAAQKNSLYPVFNLSNNNSGTIQTRTYPTINTNNTYILSSANTGLGVDGITTNSGDMGFDLSYYHAALNTNAATNWTHAGLPYLTVQNPLTGAFDLPNGNYRDTLTALAPHQTRIEAIWFPDLVDIAPGQVGLCPNLNIQVAGLDTWQANGASMGFPASNNAVMKVTNLTSFAPNFSSFDQASFDIGGYLIANKSLSTGTLASPSSGLPFYAGNAYSGSGIVIAATSTGFGNESNSGTFLFTNSSPLTISLMTTNGTIVQTVSMNFPSATMATPKLPAYNPYKDGISGSQYGNYPPTVAYLPVVSGSSFTNTNATDIVFPKYLTFNTKDPLYTNSYNPTFSGYRITFFTLAEIDIPTFLPRDIVCSQSQSPSSSWYATGMNLIGCDTIQSVEALYGDLRMIAALSNVPTGFYTTNPYYAYQSGTPFLMNGWPVQLRSAFCLQPDGFLQGGGITGYLQPLDAAGISNNTGNLAYWTTNSAQFSVLIPTNPAAIAIPATGSGLPFLQYYNNSQTNADSGFGSNAIYYSFQPPSPYTVPSCNFQNSDGIFSGIWQRGGDFDNGAGFFPDGPFINKVDEGYGVNPKLNSSYGNPYFGGAYSPMGATLMSPNRMVPSPVIFGSLPVGFGSMGSTANASTNILTNSWLTLQFSPNPYALTTNFLATKSALAGYNEAGGAITNTILPDHLLLDYFWMPVVQPYPISDPFSTAGKVNMNYQIVPFSYINRDAAMRGILKSVMITAVDESYIGVYKWPNYQGGGAVYGNTLNIANYPSGTNYNRLATNSGNFYFHYPVHLGETLRQFTNRFGQNDLFRSPSEICSLWLYPARQPTAPAPLNNTNAVTNWDSANANIKNWWYAGPGTTRKGLTGDNIRERPYSQLYPRLTTKSNTYQIHYRVQTLRQTPTAHPSDWSKWIDPSAGGVTDRILGEQRGSAMIERFIDPSDPNIPDFTTNVSSTTITGPPMDSYYRFRVFNAKQFTP